MTPNGYQLIWLFLIYSFIGWCLEVCLSAVKRRRLINKGILNAPMCTIYGFGAVAFALFLPELEHHLVFLFIGGGIVASFLEYWSGRILEWIFWGIVAVVWLKIIYPRLSDWIEKIPVRKGKIGCNILIVFMVFNMLISGAALLRFMEREQGHESANEIEYFLDTHFPDERIYQVYPNLKIV